MCTPSLSRERSLLFQTKVLNKWHASIFQSLTYCTVSHLTVFFFPTLGLTHHSNIQPDMFFLPARRTTENSNLPFNTSHVCFLNNWTAINHWYNKQMLHYSVLPITEHCSISNKELMKPCAACTCCLRMRRFLAAPWWTACWDVLMMYSISALGAPVQYIGSLCCCFFFPRIHHWFSDE